MTLEIYATAIAFTVGAFIGNVFPVVDHQEKQVSKQQVIAKGYYCETTAEGLDCQAIKLPDSQLTELNLSTQTCDHYDLVYGDCS